MKDELQRIWREAIIPFSMYHPNIPLKGKRKSTNTPARRVYGPTSRMKVRRVAGRVIDIHAILSQI
jgi:hypothetical protein